MGKRKYSVLYRGTRRKWRGTRRKRVNLTSLGVDHGRQGPGSSLIVGLYNMWHSDFPCYFFEGASLSRNTFRIMRDWAQLPWCNRVCNASMPIRSFDWQECKSTSRWNFEGKQILFQGSNGPFTNCNSTYNFYWACIEQSNDVLVLHINPPIVLLKHALRTWNFST